MWDINSQVINDKPNKTFPEEQKRWDLHLSYAVIKPAIIVCTI